MGAGDHVPPAGRGQGIRPLSQPRVGGLPGAGAGTALSRLPDTRERREQTIDLLFELRTSLIYVLGEMPKVAECLREAEELARRLDDRRRLGWVSVYTSQYLGG